jgi:histidinol-phosphate aminotransferase
MIKAKKSIYDITPYVGGEGTPAEGKRLIKLSSNEGPFGPSEMAIKGMQEAAKDMHRYPDGGCVALRDALAQKNDIKAEQIVCGAGSDEMIALLCRAYAGVGDEVLYSEHGFLMYAISAKASGATPVTAPEQNLKADVNAMADAVTENTKIVFLANPNNPTGSYLTRDEVLALHSQLPDDVLLVLDAAYAEYVEDPNYTPGHDLVEQYQNIVVTRTFSKIYGMGGVRLGWAHGPDHVIDVLNRVRGPFNVSIEAQAAGLGALQDDEFLAKTLKSNKKCRAMTTAGFEALGYKVYPSEGNFVLVEFVSAEKAEEVRLFLKNEGIYVRQMPAYGLPQCLRVTIGTAEEMSLALDVMSAYKECHG